MPKGVASEALGGIVPPRVDFEIKGRLMNADMSNYPGRSNANTSDHPRKPGPPTPSNMPTDGTKAPQAVHGGADLGKMGEMYGGGTKTPGTRSPRPAGY